MKDGNVSTDQRLMDRRALEARIEMQLETRVLAGLTDNISRAGLLFFTDQPLRVTLELLAPEGRKTYSGRLIRLQRMSETSTGLAVEFDPE